MLHKAHPCSADELRHQPGTPPIKNPGALSHISADSPCHRGRLALQLKANLSPHIQQIPIEKPAWNEILSL